MNLPLAEVRNAGYWRSLHPELRLTEAGSSAVEVAPVPDAAQRATVLEDLGREGYVQIGGVMSRDEALRLARVADALKRTGWPPVMALVYDDFWRISRRLQGILSVVLGAAPVQLPDFWVWHLDPAAEERGWPPHRDKTHPACLRPDGSPNSLTAWVALTDVTPLNGCMYILPAHLDPAYPGGALPGRDDILAGVRALPADAGTVFLWNQAVLHWGGSASRRAPMPRISVAFEFQRADVPPFNTPLIERPGELPDFATRLSLLGQQLAQYTHMTGADDTLGAVARALAGEA